MFGAGVVNQNMTHYLGGDGKKLRAALPWDVGLVNETDIGFVNQRACLKRVIAPFVS
jgi:hypothetical protein